MDAGLFVALCITALVCVSLWALTDETKSKDSSSSDNYKGDYDGGHNKPNAPDETIIENRSSDIYQGDYDGGHNKNIELEKSNQKTTIMHDLRNLTISSTNPCLIIYLLDQSGSMHESFGNASHSKTVELANAINNTIYEIGLRCIGNAGELKNRFEVAIIGYGKGENAVQSAWEGQLANKWVVSIKKYF